MKRILSLLTLLGSALQSHATGYYSHRDMIAAVLMGEARGEGEEGLRAVAQVVRNRGGDPLMQVLRRRQFSCLNGTTIEKLTYKMKREKGWKLAQRIAEQLLSNPEQLGDETKGAKFYERTGHRAFWTARFRKVATVGNHDFFLP